MPPAHPVHIAHSRRGLSLGQTELRAVYRSGKRHVTPVATVHALSSPGGQVRLAVPVGKRIGGAVARNRVRRRIREAFGRVKGDLRLGADIVIVAKGPAGSVPFGELIDSLRAAIHELHL